jgi:hypothetical protein
MYRPRCRQAGQHSLAKILLVTVLAVPAAAACGRTPGLPSQAYNLQLTSVSCITINSCEAVGSYMTSSGSGVAGTPIAGHWDGTRWEIQTMGTPPGGSMPYLSSLSCASANSCEAVGLYNRGKTLVPLAERWDGTSWMLQRTGIKQTNEALVQVSCTTPDRCEAVGNRGARQIIAGRWDGTSWVTQQLPSPNPPTSSITWAGLSCANANACEAVGVDTGRTGSRQLLAERWDGTRWAAQTMPAPQGGDYVYPSGVSCVTPDRCETVGTVTNNIGYRQAFAERWDGRTWQLQPAQIITPSEQTMVFVNGVSCYDADFCEAVGYYGSANTSAAVAGTFRWDGTRWAWQTIAATPRSQGENPISISCPGVNNCEIVGLVLSGGSGDRTKMLAGKWDNQTWHRQPVPTGNGGA